MPACEECGMAYTSQLAAAECAEFDRAEDERVRQAVKRASRHACPYELQEED